MIGVTKLTTMMMIIIIVIIIIIIIIIIIVVVVVVVVPIIVITNFQIPIITMIIKIVNLTRAFKLKIYSVFRSEGKI